jgi:hypothetical protein
MAWTLEFQKVGGDPIGRITYDGSKMNVDKGLGSLVQEDETPDDVLGRYDGWSNGYVQSRRVS